MTSTPAPRPEVLVAIDYGPVEGVTPSVALLKQRLGGAVLKVESTEIPHHRDAGRMLPKHLITFDTNVLRNTEAHGIGFRCGFVVHIEEVSR